MDDVVNYNDAEDHLKISPTNSTEESIPVINSVASEVDDGEWTIQIKTVGETHKDFSVTIHPGEPVSRLYEEIGHRTGLSKNEQRLIYRGRILTSDTRIGKEQVEKEEEEEEEKLSRKNPSKLRDIVGLTDGHTIHLMRKHFRVNEENEEPDSLTSETVAPTATLSSGTPSSSLLTALFGDRGDRATNRRTHFRLEQSDLVRPEPGSMEPVRQGLLTMHTLNSPQRQFYLGQWIDCRDTVNQWLEATIVNIVHPYELFPATQDIESMQNINESTSVAPTTDPAISVTDLDGRRKLLLELCDEQESEEQIDGVHYRRRQNNATVQLLHVHYNGWPVRWDEWIRSDSERIRPFRVRTRHSLSGPFASPTVTTALQNPPSTLISDDETNERQALLPELYWAINQVHTILESAMSNNNSSVSDAREHLPWSSREVPPLTLHQDDTTQAARQYQLQSLAPMLDRLGRILIDSAPFVAALANTDNDTDTNNNNNDDDNNNVAVSEYEGNQDSEHSSSSTQQSNSLGGLLSLLSRDRRTRYDQSVASSNAAVPSGDVSASLASSTTGGNEHPNVHLQEADDDDDDGDGDDDDDDDEEEDEIIEEEESSEQIPEPDLSDFRTGFVNTSRGELRNGPRNGSSSSSDDVANFLGAYLAAASLGSITSIGTNSEGGGGGGEDAAEGLGRLLRDRGNGGGIDIHIHAVMTAPSTGDGGLGMATMGGVGTTSPLIATPTNGGNAGIGTLFASVVRDSPRRNGARRFRSANTPASGLSQTWSQSSNDDDLGIFDDLYSENPEPVNPNGPSSTDTEMFPPTGSSQTDNQMTSDEIALSTTSVTPSRESRPRRREAGRGVVGSRNINGVPNHGVLGRFFRRNTDRQDQ